MSRLLSQLFLAVCFVLFVTAGVVVAENEGQDDLDKATQLKVTAETLDDLNEVVDHADTALEKGLDDDNKKFAEQLLISSLLQRGQLFAGAVFNVPAQDPNRGMRSMQFRQFALSDLQRAVSLDDKIVDAHLLIGKLQSLPLGDPNAARKALSKVIDATDATPDQKAEAYSLRSVVQKDKEKQLADMAEAIKLKPDNADYLRLRAQRLYEDEKFDEALADTDRALNIEPDHATTNELRGMILLGLDKYDEALKSFDRSSELVPEAALPYQHRGELFRQKGDMQKAIEQLSKALELSPDNINALLLRASIYFEQKETDKALADIDKAIELQPTLAHPHLMKVEVLAATKQLDKAIEHLEKLQKTFPGNDQVLDRLGSFYLMANRPRKAIDIADQILAKDADSYSGLRLRADAYLNIGKHAEAIADFDKALGQKDTDEGLLNNYAWVLATSPEDKLRDGSRAIKMATKAAEASGYETPHVLSTLAAAYAETGDYDNAVKWSEKSIAEAQKAVDEAKPDDDKTKLEIDRDQLKKELQSYLDKKPTRERQSVEEATDSPPADRAAAPADKSTKPEGTSGL
jgi:tetratricopeptide (TPR) repeat protein